MTRKGLSFKSLLQAEQAASYLEDLAASIRAGTVNLSHGDERVVLTPKQTLALELSASEKKDKQKLSLELSWRTLAETTSPGTGLVISAEAPPPTEEASTEESDEEDVDEEDVEEYEDERENPASG